MADLSECVVPHRVPVRLVPTFRPTLVRRRRVLANRIMARHPVATMVRHTPIRQPEILPSNRPIFRRPKIFRPKIASTEMILEIAAGEEEEMTEGEEEIGETWEIDLGQGHRRARGHPDRPSILKDQILEEEVTGEVTEDSHQGKLTLKNWKKCGKIG